MKNNNIPTITTDNILTDDELAFLTAPIPDMCPIVVYEDAPCIIVVNDVPHTVRINTIKGFVGSTYVTIDGKHQLTNFTAERLPVYKAAIKICKLENRLSVVDCAVDRRGRHVANHFALVDAGNGDLSDFWKIHTISSKEFFGW